MSIHPSCSPFHGCELPFQPPWLSTCVFVTQSNMQIAYRHALVRGPSSGRKRKVALVHSQRQQKYLYFRTFASTTGLGLSSARAVLSVSLVRAGSTTNARRRG